MNLPSGLSNHSSVDTIPESIRDEIFRIANGIVQILPGIVESVYLQGSAGRGEYLEGVSDIDLLVVLTRPRNNQERDAWNRFIEDEPSFMNLDIEVGFTNTVAYAEKPMIQFQIHTDAVLLNGKNLPLTLVLPSTGMSLAKFLNADTLRDLDQAKQWQKAGHSGDAYRNHNRWLAKKIIRLCFGFALIQGAPYVAGIQEIGKSIASFAPEYKVICERALIGWQYPDSDQAAFDLLLADYEAVSRAADFI